jgi:hypothetical protein
LAAEVLHLVNVIQTLVHKMAVIHCLVHSHQVGGKLRCLTLLKVEIAGAQYLVAPPALVYTVLVVAQGQVHTEAQSTVVPALIQISLETLLCMEAAVPEKMIQLLVLLPVAVE